MPQSTAKTKPSTQAKRRRGRTIEKKARRGRGGRRENGKASPVDRRDPSSQAHPQVVINGRVEYVQVPVDEYERLIKSSMIEEAIAILNDPDEGWVDADDFALELAAERVARARKAAGMTQKQLAAKLKVPQSQISRIERNPDHTTVRTLRRIAKALGVDVSALV
ncbi:MAG: helix-turn-helix transcriptional regulator [Planctomycetota bacterium]